jgi:nicotinamidase-related amidase
VRIIELEVSTTMGARRSETASENPSSRGRSPRAADLYGSAPDRSTIAVLLIDVINDMEFPGGETLAARARPVGAKLATLRKRARRAKVPTIYANDNFGRWRSDFSAQVEHCLNDGVRGRDLARLLKPAPDDYFVLKPKHSAFYQTCLELLLEHLGVKTLILGGVTTDSCVTFTASDAYLRGYSLRVLSDGCAALDTRLHRDALAHMQRALHAEIASSERVSLRAASRTKGRTA